MEQWTAISTFLDLLLHSLLLDCSDFLQSRKSWRGRRDSNSRSLPWQGSVLGQATPRPRNYSHWSFVISKKLKIENRAINRYVAISFLYSLLLNCSIALIFREARQKIENGKWRIDRNLLKFLSIVLFSIFDCSVPITSIGTRRYRIRTCDLYNVSVAL